MHFTDIIACAVSAVASSALTAAIFQWWVKNTLDRVQAHRDAEAKRRRERYAVEDEYDHCVGRVLFWLKHGAQKYEQVGQKGYWNGELEKAFENLEAVEAKKKEIVREQLAEINTEK